MSMRTTLFTLLLAGTALGSSAQDVGQHPAVFSPRQHPGVDVSTSIVGHPASPRWSPVAPPTPKTMSSIRLWRLDSCIVARPDDMRRILPEVARRVPR